MFMYLGMHDKHFFGSRSENDPVCCFGRSQLTPTPLFHHDVTTKTWVARILLRMAIDRSRIAHQTLWPRKNSLLEASIDLLSLSYVYSSSVIANECCRALNSCHYTLLLLVLCTPATHRWPHSKLSRSVLVVLRCHFHVHTSTSILP